MSNPFVSAIQIDPGSVSFQKVIAHIDVHYYYTPNSFDNGEGDDCVNNAAGTNEGSCKIFSFAQLAGLSAEETLACFGDYYRNDVLNHPDGQDHTNIRTFMRHGWAGIHFQGSVLVAK